MSRAAHHERPRRASPRWVPCLLIVVLVAAIELARRAGFVAPIPFLLLLGTTVAAGLFSGRLCGLACGLISASYVGYSAIFGFGPETLTGGAPQVLAGAALFVGAGWLVGRVRDQRDELMRTVNRDRQALRVEVERHVEEAKVRQSRLLQAQKLDAIGQLTGGVAHDFNNILLIVIGNLELAREGVNERTAAAIDEALDAAERGAQLTRRLLAYASKQHLVPRSVDPAALIAGMESLLRRTLSEDIVLEFRAENDLWRIEVDPGELETVLLNLVVNARDAMPGGGRLILEAANARLDSGDHVRLSVIDTGHGIDPGIVDRLFDPFFTTKQPGEGTGLGLSMAHGFVRQSGGTIEIDSTPDAGTAVTIHLPRMLSSPATKPSPVAGERALRQETGERVLLVEDDSRVRAVIAGQLEALGYGVRVASSGEEALEEASGVDLLLTDVVLSGGMSGREISERALERNPRLRTVFMSGYTRGALARRGDIDDETTLLRKPFRTAELAAVVHRALASPAADG